MSERGRATYHPEGLVLWLDGAIFDITEAVGYWSRCDRGCLTSFSPLSLWARALAWDCRFLTRLVDRHGGRLSCISTLGEGAEFLIEIPVRSNLTGTSSNVGE